MKPREKRQKVSKSLIIISLLLFPITLYYLSPYLIIEGIVAGVITGSFIMFIAMFIVRGMCRYLSERSDSL